MEFAIIGIAVFFNLAGVKWKIDKERYVDAGLDFAALVAITIASLCKLVLLRIGY